MVDPKLQPQTFYTHNTDPDSVPHPCTTLCSTTLPLVLRIPTADDLLVMREILQNPLNVQNDLSIVNLDKIAIEALTTSWLSISLPLTHLAFVVLAEGMPVGISGMGWIGPYSQSSNPSTSSNNCDQAGAAGIMLNPEMRGKGYAYEALRMTIDYGLRVLGLKEVRVGTPSANVAMRGLMERKFGMLPEVEEPDRFGNDLLWRIEREEWLMRPHV